MLTDPVVRSSHVASDDTTTPGFAVVIATRNRGAKVVATLDSIFANGSWKLQVVVVDQSDGRETEAAVKRFKRSYPRRPNLPSRRDPDHA